MAWVGCIDLLVGSLLSVLTERGVFMSGQCEPWLGVEMDDCVWSKR
jgi:hypothetical protein